MMESISTTRIDILNSKIPNSKLSYLKVTKDSVPHFNSYLDQKILVLQARGPLSRTFSYVVYRDISLQCPLHRKGTIQLTKPGLQQAITHNPCRQVDITPVASLGIRSMQFNNSLIV